MYVFGNRDTGQFKERRRIVYVLNHFGNISFSVESFRQTHNQWSTHGLFIHKAFVKPTVLTHVEPLVGSIDHQCIIQQILFFQIIKHAAHIIIQCLHHLGIITHITLEFPIGKFFSLRILLIELLNNRSIKIIILFALFRCQTSDKVQISRFQA